MPGIGIILNPYSRSNRKHPERIKKLGFIVGDKGSCHSTETLDEVRDLAHEFKERRIDILGLSGGDGTNHRTLSAFMDVYGETPLPRVALLRGGTMNNLASQLGIHGQPERILSNVILKYHEGESFVEKQVNLVRVNGAYGFLFGMGLVTRFIERYQEMEEPNPAWALRLLSLATCSALVNGKFARRLAERFDCRITLDGKVQPFKNYNMIFAGTMKTLGFNFRPLYRCDSLPGQFQIIGISATPRELLATFPQAFLARPARSENYVDEMCRDAVLEFERPMSYTVDGDIAAEPTTRIELGMGPTLTFIAA
jgi:diacylglycerol kinase (ATP)